METTNVAKWIGFAVLPDAFIIFFQPNWILKSVRETQHRSQPLLPYMFCTHVADVFIWVVWEALIFVLHSKCYLRVFLVSLCAGYYIYSLASFDKSTVLRSPTYNRLNSTGCSFSLWYHITGGYGGRFRVRLFDGNRVDTLFSRDSSTGYYWRRATMSIGKINTPFFYVGINIMLCYNLRCLFYN